MATRFFKMLTSDTGIALAGGIAVMFAVVALLGR